MICLKQDQRYFDFINEKLNADFERVKSRCIAVIDSNNAILGVVVFDRFTQWGCELNVAGITPRFFSKQLVLATFHYIFVTCGKIRATTIVREDNERSLKMQHWLGFIEEARLKNIYGDKDGIVFRMLKNECKWLGVNHG